MSKKYNLADFYFPLFTGSSLQETRVAGLEGMGCGQSGGERVTKRATDVGECLPGDVEGMDDDGPTDVAHYSIYALQKLQQLNEKLGHKHDALKALTASGQQNHKVYISFANPSL